MKKFIALFLVLALSLSLCACGKSPLVKNVEKQIEALAHVTYEDEEAVKAARQAYNRLLASDQKKVKNVDILEQAEATIRQILEQVPQQADQICVDYSPDEALAKLAELEQLEYVKQCRRAVASRLLQSIVLEQGVPCDILGEEDAEGAYRKVAVGNCAFVTDPAGYTTVTFYEQNDAPVSNILLGGYQFTMRNRSIYVSEDGAHYLKTEHFAVGEDYFYVSWDTPIDATAKAELENLPIQISNSNHAYWPYDLDAQHIETSIASDADEFLAVMDNGLKALGMPCTVYELIGIFE